MLYFKTTELRTLVETNGRNRLSKHCLSLALVLESLHSLHGLDCFFVVRRFTVLGLQLQLWRSVDFNVNRMEVLTDWVQVCDAVGEHYFPELLILISSYFDLVVCVCVCVQRRRRKHSISEAPRYVSVQTPASRFLTEEFVHTHSES